MPRSVIGEAIRKYGIDPERKEHWHT